MAKLWFAFSTFPDLCLGRQVGRSVRASTLWRTIAILPWVVVRMHCVKVESIVRARGRCNAGREHYTTLLTKLINQERKERRSFSATHQCLRDFTTRTNVRSMIVNGHCFTRGPCQNSRKASKSTSKIRCFRLGCSTSNLSLGVTTQAYGVSS